MEHGSGDQQPHGFSGSLRPLTPGYILWDLLEEDDLSDEPIYVRSNNLEQTKVYGLQMELVL